MRIHIKRWRSELNATSDTFKWSALHDNNYMLASQLLCGNAAVSASIVQLFIDVTHNLLFLFMNAFLQIESVL